MSTVAEPFYVTGGTLPATALSYIEREADRALFDAVMDGQFSYVLNSRQMGKSSLCVRTMQRLNAAGVTTAFVDLTRLGGKNVNPDQWYAGLLGELGRKLQLRTEMLEFWRSNAELGPMQRLFATLHEVALVKRPGRIAVFIDEIDATRSLSFDKDEFFAGIRECYNRRVEDPAYGRLTICLLGVALPNDLISNPVSTPFNIGRRIFLKDFTLEEVKGFARGIAAVDEINGGAPRSADQLVQRVHYWTNGHPFLTQSLCSAVAQTTGIRTVQDVDELIHRNLLEPKARETNINLADVASRALNAGVNEPDPEKFRADLLSLYGRAREPKGILDDESNRAVALLKLSGLVRTAGNRIHVRNRIYESIFDRKWIRDILPGQELRRQRRAFWKGAIRVTLISAVVIAAVTTLAVSNYLLARKAELAAQEAGRQRDRAEYEAYVSEVGLMRAASDDKDRYELGQLLDRTSGSRYRGIEWGYWYNREHDAVYESPYPKGQGLCSVAGDGRSISVLDVSQSKARIFSFPELKPLSPLLQLRPQDSSLFTAHGWVTVQPNDPHSIRFSDPVTLRSIAVLERPGFKVTRFGGSVTGSFFVQAWLKEGDDYAAYFDLLDPNLKLLARLHLKGSAIIDAPAISVDGKRVAFNENPLIGGRPASYCVVRVREAATAKILDEFAPPKKVSDLNLYLFPSGNYFAVSTPDGQITVRDVSNHRSVWTVKLPEQSTLNALDHERILVAATLSGQLYAWDWRQHRLIRQMPSGGSIDLDPAGNFFASVGGGTRVYRLQESDRSPSFSVGSTLFGLAGITPAGEAVVRNGRQAVYLNPDTLRPSRPAVPLADISYNLTKDGMYLVRPGPTGADLVSVADGKPLFHLPELKDTCALGASPDGERFLVVAQNRPLASLYDRSGRLISAVRFGSVYAAPFLAASRDSRLFVFADEAKVTVMDRDGKVVRTLSGPDTQVSLDAGFDGAGSRLAVGYGTGALTVYDLAGKSAPVECRGAGQPMCSVMFNAAGDRVLTGEANGMIRLWDPKTGRELLRIPIANSQPVACTFSKDERAILYSDPAGLIKRIELTPSRPLK